jgi:sirohydrochlorin ferrochelatase
MTSDRRLAVLVSHGQPSAPEPPEAGLAALASETAALLPGWDIRSATLSTAGRLEQQAAEGAVIYPFFMARGWFTATVLPRRLAGVPHSLACPFGLDPALPGLAAEAVAQDADRRGWQDGPDGLLLAAHGSARGPKAAEAAEAFAAALSPLLPRSSIRCGYVEQDPGIAASARALPARTLCLPFFAQSGDHVTGDIPGALAEAAFAGALLPAAGALPGVARLIADAISRTAEHRPTESSG